MSLSYAKVTAELPIQVREVSDYNSFDKKNIIPSKSELYLESTDVHEDTEGNLWIYCPRNKMYYELYRKSENSYLIEIFPTIPSEVTYDCKSGLAMHKNHDQKSEIIVRKQPGEIYDITSTFFIDENGTTWVRSINIINGENGYSTIDGWVIYKNRRNNFANLYIHGKYKVLTTNGELDEEKLENFKEYLKKIRCNWMYRADQPLQLFASKKAKKVKTAKSSASAISYDGDKSISESGISKRKAFPFKQHRHRIKDITTHSKNVVQNSRSFPKKIGTENGINTYNYFMNYSGDGILANMSELREHYNFDIQSYKKLYNKLMSSYNRFKLANPNDVLSRGFPHVFFTRPDCNFFSSKNKLVKNVSSNPNVSYAFAHKPELLEMLSQTSNNDWNWLLSNKASSFQTSDESIGNDVYGTTFHKNSIAYGKSNRESKAAGSISIEFADTKELDILHLMKLWTDYIDKVYHGNWRPKSKYIWKKILDYACSCYYIITAEDGETIIFWSKYYGVFPVNVPSSAYSWSTGSPIQQQSLNITFQYSFKEDFNPATMVEFNMNSKIKDLDRISYVDTYNPNLGTTGYTWVGKPFIELQSKTNGDYVFKLRFES